MEVVWMLPYAGVHSVILHDLEHYLNGVSSRSADSTGFPFSSSLYIYIGGPDHLS